MPELPEVETIRLVLQRKIVGKTIKDIEILSPKSFIGNPKKIRGKKVLNVWRKGKYLGVDLSPSLRDPDISVGTKQSIREIAALPTVARNDDYRTLLIHLKMTGQLILEDRSLKIDDGRFVGGHPTEDMMGKMPSSHTRVIFTFSDGSKLYFNDQRRFGWVKIIQNSEFRIQNLFKKLGPEPFDKNFTWQILKSNLLNHKSQPVKVALMDQSVVSGVGNIYANEACFNAKFDPRTKINNLSDLQFKKLHLGILKSLKDGISHGGSTRAHFRDPKGHKGYFLDYAKVYGLDKHPCKVCKTIIKKIQLGGRGTYFCERCQS